ncbi:MAG: hypothetical protein FJZ57_04555 [Chlamydiae bacterium]|nr:hypothetical protein [Chlamydiota bacterium]
MPSFNPLSRDAGPSIQTHTHNQTTSTFSFSRILDYCRSVISSITDSFNSTTSLASMQDHQVTIGSDNSSGFLNTLHLRMTRTTQIPIESLEAQIQAIDQMISCRHTSEYQDLYRRLPQETKNIILSALTHAYHKTDYPRVIEAILISNVDILKQEIPAIIHSSGGTVLQQVKNKLLLEKDKAQGVITAVDKLTPIENLRIAIEDPSKFNEEVLAVFDQLPERLKNKTYGEVYQLTKHREPQGYRGKWGEDSTRTNIRILKELTDETGLTILEKMTRSVKADASQELEDGENKELFRSCYASNLFNHQELKVLWKKLPQETKIELFSTLSLEGSPEDTHFYGKGIRSELYNFYGTNRQADGKIQFRVFAPNARDVKIDIIKYVDDAQTHRSVNQITMKKNIKTGDWEALTELDIGTKYQYIISPSDSRTVLRKADPYAKESSIGYLNHKFQQFSVVANEDFHWGDAEQAFLSQRSTSATETPRGATIYELHVTSWKKKEDGSNLNWVELGQQLSEYCCEMNYTHVELIGAMEHPSERSWGYQVSGYFSPNHRMGTLSQFKEFVKIMHTAGIQVIVDWVPGHFALDEFNTSKFDGSAIYEHSDSRRSYLSWGVVAHDFEKRYIRDYLISSAAYLTKELHIDGLRIDAMDPILHTNKCRASAPSGNPLFLPHPKGKNGYPTKTSEGHEFIAETHPDAKKFFRDLSCIIRNNDDGSRSGVSTFPEESSGFPLLTSPVSYKEKNTTEETFNQRGLGMTAKWDMAQNWKETRSYWNVTPEDRFFSALIEALMNDQSEYIVSALNHDEVSHSKTKEAFPHRRALKDSSQDQRSLDRKRQIELYHAFRYFLPGIKLNMMGIEFNQQQEWSGRLKESIDAQERGESQKSAVEWGLL